MNDEGFDSMAEVVDVLERRTGTMLEALHRVGMLANKVESNYSVRIEVENLLAVRMWLVAEDEAYGIESEMSSEPQSDRGVRHAVYRLLGDSMEHWEVASLDDALRKIAAFMEPTSNKPLIPTP